MTDLNKIAAEALDLWQEHLTSLANNPAAKADMAALMEPSRRLFAEWAEKAQSTAHGFATFTPPTPSGAAPVSAAADDGALRLAQLALHVAQLEQRVVELEKQLAAKTRRAAKPKQP